MINDKKQNLKFSKKTSEKLFSNLTDGKRNNYLYNVNINNDTFSNSNINKEHLKKNIYNYEIDGNNLDISENYNTLNKLINNNSNENDNTDNINIKFSQKLNISPYNKKRFSTLSNNNENDIEKNEIDLKNNEDIENIENMNNKFINDNNYDNLYNELINTKNNNISLRNKINYLNKIIQKKNQIIKKLYLDNTKNQKRIKKLINDNQIKLNMNKNFMIQIKNLRNEILLLKNGDKNIDKNINVNNNKIYKESIYFKEINELKEKLKKYEMENNKLKILLIKNNEKQYSNDISRKALKNSFANYSEKNKESVNYREYNKSVSISKSKNKINIDKSITKNYKEDKDIKSLDEKIVNIYTINKE